MTNEDRFREAERRLWESEGVSPKEDRIHLARNNVAIRVQEVGGGQPVVFLHGANASGLTWATLASRLQEFRCILVDRPGTGLSESTKKGLDVETLPRFAESLVVDVLDALELESAHLVATSFGGYIGLRAAAASPARIKRMVQFSWPVGASNAPLPMMLRLMAAPGIGRVMSALPATRGSVKMIFRSIGHGASLKSGRITERDIEAYFALLRYTETTKNEMAMGRALITGRRLNPEITLTDDVLSKIQTPIYFLWGEKDPFGNGEIAAGLVERLPNAEFEVLAGAGHAPWLDDPDYCAKTVKKFLRDEQ